MGKRESLQGTRGVLEYDPGAVGNFHYREVLGLVALASSEQAVLEVNVYTELVGRAQMTNTDETQVALVFIIKIHPGIAAVSLAAPD